MTDDQDGPRGGKGRGVTDSAAQAADTEAVVRRWLELYDDGTSNSYGSDRYLQLFAPDVIYESMPNQLAPNGQVIILAETRQALGMLDNVFHDRHVELVEVLTQGTRAAVRYV